MSHVLFPRNVLYKQTKKENINRENYQQRFILGGGAFRLGEAQVSPGLEN
jgi:hypothetical protein